MRACPLAQRIRIGPVQGWTRAAQSGAPWARSVPACRSLPKTPSVSWTLPASLCMRLDRDLGPTPARQHLEHKSASTDSVRRETGHARRHTTRTTQHYTRQEQHHTRPHKEPPPSLNTDRRWRGDGVRLNQIHADSHNICEVRT